MGVAEVAEALGWSRGRVTTYTARGILPAPVASLRAGQVWRCEDIEAFRDSPRGQRR